MKTIYKYVIGLILVLLTFATVSFFLTCISHDYQGITEESEPMENGGEANGDMEPLGNVDRLLDEMEFGNIAFNTPVTINIDSSRQIQLLLSLAKDIEQLKQSITAEGHQVGATIKISDRMEARLSGYMFEITAITKEVQAVSKTRQTEWKWEIHPKEIGRHELHLTLTALLDINGYDTPRTIRTFDRIIEVNITGKQKISGFFNNNWQLLLTAIFIPVAGWLWKRRKNSGR